MGASKRLALWESWQRKLTERVSWLALPTHRTYSLFIIHYFHLLYTIIYYIYKRNFDQKITKFAQKMSQSEKYATKKTENVLQNLYSPAFVEKICGNSKTKKEVAISLVVLHKKQLLNFTNNFQFFLKKG